jgi:AsmA family protein
VNLQDEAMDLKIHPHTKGFRIFSLRSPLYVKGTFKQPHVGVDAAALALRGGAMVGLGLINPFAALIPLIAPSNNQPLPCDALMKQISTERPLAPPPGVKEKAPAGASMPAAASAAGSSPSASRKAAQAGKAASAAGSTTGAAGLGGNQVNYSHP